MKHLRTSLIRLSAVATFAAMAASVGLAQDPQDSRPPVDPHEQQTPAGGWRRATDPAPATSTMPAPTPDPNAAAAPANPNYRPLDSYGQSREVNPNDPMQGAYPARPDYRVEYPARPVPNELTIKPGTYLTVRIDQALSSDHNHAGDAFSATLAKPLIVDGVIVAQRGQTLGGRVVEAQKAGRVQGVSRLGVELIDLPLVDGQQLPIKTQFISHSGDTSVGRDVGAIAGTTALGAAAGAIAADGFGAAVGAGAGAFVGLVGVLTTRGHASVIYPESVVTFRIETPITISTARAPQAFRYVDARDYERADALQQRAPRLTHAAPYPYYGAYPYYGPVYSPYYYPYYGGLWGPSIGFYYGGRWGGGYRHFRR